MSPQDRFALIASSLEQGQLLAQAEAAEEAAARQKPGYWDYFKAFNEPDTSNVFAFFGSIGCSASKVCRVPRLFDDLGDVSKVRKIGGRYPINSKWAGRTHPSGVRFTAEGFPDFGPWAKARVQLKGLSGKYRKDARLANQAAGLPKTPRGMVWHHVEDGRTMLLIPRSIHRAAMHTGGSAVIRSGGR